MKDHDGPEDGPEMTDERLNELMKDAAPLFSSYRLPKDPPLDAMWARIEREHFDAAPVAAPDVRVTGVSHEVRRIPSTRRWIASAAGIAATLIVGFGLGRVTAPTDPELPAVTVATATEGERPVADPLKRTTSAYLDEAEVLLASLPRDGKGIDANFVSSARQLLTTTRVLLDSPAGSDPRLRDMLEDLELVLAQVARLRATPRAEELTFIAEAMDERDMVPRLRTVAAALSYSDY